MTLEGRVGPKLANRTESGGIRSPTVRFQMPVFRKVFPGAVLSRAGSIDRLASMDRNDLDIRDAEELMTFQKRERPKLEHPLRCLPSLGVVSLNQHLRQGGSPSI